MAIPLKLNSSKENEIRFTVVVDGDEQVKDSRFTLVMENGKRVSYPVDYSDQTAVVIIPAEKYTGKYDAVLEMVVGDYYLKPLEMTIEFEKPTEVKVEGVKAETKSKRPTVTASAEAAAALKEDGCVAADAAMGAPAAGTKSSVDKDPNKAPKDKKGKDLTKKRIEEEEKEEAAEEKTEPEKPDLFAAFKSTKK